MAWNLTRTSFAQDKIPPAWFSGRFHVKLEWGRPRRFEQFHLNFCAEKAAERFTGESNHSSVFLGGAKWISQAATACNRPETTNVPSDPPLAPSPTFKNPDRFFPQPCLRTPTFQKPRSVPFFPPSPGLFFPRRGLLSYKSWSLTKASQTAFAFRTPRDKVLSIAALLAAPRHRFERGEGPKGPNSPSRRMLDWETKARWFQGGALVPVLFYGEGSPTKIHYREKSWYPYSNLSTGGPSKCFSPAESKGPDRPWRGLGELSGRVPRGLGLRNAVCVCQVA